MRSGTVSLSPILLLLACGSLSQACTNLLVSRGASSDDSNIIAYNADAANFYTSVYHYPAGLHKNGTLRKTYTWDYGTYLGEIPEAAETYNVVGNVNEHGLVITESTFGGLLELVGSRRTGLIDYGNLIWITLQRATTAREAISTMAWLVETYGYASTGESFSIADPQELWVMELIGKGRHETGAVWVARRVPQGHVTGHANQARITTFPLQSPDDTLYAPDTISFAQSLGLYPNDRPDEEFSFSDTYDPVTFEGARFCEARVWSFLGAVMGEQWAAQYLDYAEGYNLTNRMPLWVQPPQGQKLSPQDVMQAMRSHYEGTALDSSGQTFPDVGAAQYSDPNRKAPLQWSASNSPGKSFFNERNIAQAPTGWSIVCQARPHVPRQMAALLWFGIDDSSTSVHWPLYGSATRIPPSWAGQGPQDGVTPPLMTFSLDSAFYVFNLVANFAYSRWDLIYTDLHATILAKEAEYFQLVVETDAKAMSMFEDENEDVTDVVEYLTSFSYALGDALTKDWFVVFGQLFVKFRDGYVTTASDTAPVCGCHSQSAGYQDEWYNRIVDDTGDVYLVPPQAEDEATLKRTTRKSDLRAFN